MKGKTFRGFKSNQPLFKVKISKRQKPKKSDEHSLPKCTGSVSGRSTEVKKVNVFMTVSKIIKIPSPPDFLIKKIEEEKQKLKVNKFYGDNIFFWDPYVYWGDESLFSITEVALNNINTKSSRKGSSEKPLNSFMAFRAYNSQFGYGLKQNILSSLLADAWHSNPEQQKIWDTFAQQFNFVKPKCGFVEWVDQRYERESCI
ncbi:HMLalpha1_B (YCR040W) [Zygosaccharomyces parabailii]|nr:HMLalpha1_B (YCR040W) [Zygosaccharomyces parabailii]